MKSLIVLLILTRLAFAGAAISSYLKKDENWFTGDEARSILANVLSYQSATGGWPKNTDTANSPYRGGKKELRGTFDNGATTDELRFLARIEQASKNDRARQAFELGLRSILEGQYPNGGWPQFYLPGNRYHRHITFNDGSMVRIMQFLREVAYDPLYRFVAQADRECGGVVRFGPAQGHPHRQSERSSDIGRNQQDRGCSPRCRRSLGEIL